MALGYAAGNVVDGAANVCWTPTFGQSDSTTEEVRNTPAGYHVSIIDMARRF